MKTITITKPTVRTRWQGLPAGVKIVRGIEFKVAGQRRLLLDIYLPEAPGAAVPLRSGTPSRTASLPVVIWFCGGGWRGMSRFGPPVVSAWLAGHGFAVIGADYRVSGEAKFPAAVEDCCDVVRWVRRHGKKHGLDPKRIGTWGDSAGGHLAAIVGLKMKVQAVAAYCPPTELALMPIDVVQEFIGGTPAKKPRAYAAASPVTHVRRGAPPHLIVHGTEDKTVPFEQATRYAALLDDVGADVTLVRFPGVGHDSATLYSALQMKRMVARFFETWLKP
jgi:acetyl esterase/lipase